MAFWQNYAVPVSSLLTLIVIGWLVVAATGLLLPVMAAIVLFILAWVALQVRSALRQAEKASRDTNG